MLLIEIQEGLEGHCLTGTIMYQLLYQVIRMAWPRYTIDICLVHEKSAICDVRYVKYYDIRALNRLTSVSLKVYIHGVMSHHIPYTIQCNRGSNGQIIRYDAISSVYVHVHVRFNYLRFANITITLLPLHKSNVIYLTIDVIQGDCSTFKFL